MKFLFQCPCCSCFCFMKPKAGKPRVKKEAAKVTETPKVEEPAAAEAALPPPAAAAASKDEKQE
ncbi:hypothetical protein LINGRAHAP2_LOCUS31944 [Linum grandiflorum]